MKKKVVFKKHTKKWSKLSEYWDMFAEPSRPSRGDIINYNKLLSEALKSKKQADILVLGSTPEIRELLFKFSATHGAKITCLDMTRNMYEAMSNLMDMKNKYEKFVLGNWVDTKFKNKFDIIIGDYVNGNIGEEYRDRYFKNILSNLKNGGSFITRDCVVNPDCKVKNIEEVFRRHLKEVKDEEYSIKKASSIAINTFIWASWFLNKENIMKIDFYWDAILKLSKKSDATKTEDGALVKAIYDRFLYAGDAYRGKHWTIYSKSDNLKTLGKYFNIKKTLYAHDYGKILTKASPMYLLQKK